jgi:UDP-N-acetylglucosamine pyrophosphorylase
MLAAQGAAEQVAAAEKAAANGLEGDSPEPNKEEAKAGSSPPLAIMVSDDTESAIRALLEEHSYFGLDKSRVVLLKQEKVAALSDANAAFAMSDAYTVATKPHGHGDVHFLLHSSGTCRQWHEQGVRWLHFFQDTNTLYFSNFLATLGVSATHQARNRTHARTRTHADERSAACAQVHAWTSVRVCECACAAVGAEHPAVGAERPPCCVAMLRSWTR